MRKIILIQFIIFIIFNLFPSEKNSNIEKFYGIKNFNENDELKLFEYNNEILSLIELIKSDYDKLEEINKYLYLINNDTLQGFLIKDSLLIYLPSEITDELGIILKKYLRIHNNQAIKEILKIRSNNGNYIFSKFNMTTKLKRFNFDEVKLSIILPNFEWKELVFKDDNEKKKDLLNKSIDRSISLISGEDSYACSLFISKEKINPKNLDLTMHRVLKPQYIIKDIPYNGLKDIKEENFEEVVPGNLKLIAENIIINNKKIDKIFEVITASPERKNSQMLISRVRFFVLNSDLYVFLINIIIFSENALAQKINLIKSSGYLLDTIKFY